MIEAAPENIFKDDSSLAKAVKQKWVLKFEQNYVLWYERGQEDSWGYIVPGLTCFAWFHFQSL